MYPSATTQSSLSSGMYTSLAEQQAPMMPAIQQPQAGTAGYPYSYPHQQALPLDYTQDYSTNPYWTAVPSTIPPASIQYSYSSSMASGLPGLQAPIHDSPYLSSQSASISQSRSPSLSSTNHYSSASNEVLPSTYSRGISPESPDLRAYGYQNENGTWTCAYPGCTSRAVFTRGCDLRKHHKRHTKSFFCRHEGCPQSTGGGFSSKKDLARHEAKHNPGVLCEWEGCDRLFSRVDNMVRESKILRLKLRELTLFHRETT